MVVKKQMKSEKNEIPGDYLLNHEMQSTYQLKRRES